VVRRFDTTSAHRLDRIALTAVPSPFMCAQRVQSDASFCAPSSAGLCCLYLGIGLRSRRSQVRHHLCAIPWPQCGPLLCVLHARDWRAFAPL